MTGQPRVAVGLNAVIVAVTEEVPRILTLRAGRAGGDGRAEEALPFGPLDPEHDRTLDRGLRRWVHEQTGLSLGYVEQLYTFGDRDRDPRARRRGLRVVSVAYLALVREVSVGVEAHWRDWYEFFPWEDWRGGRPPLIDDAIAPALAAWVDYAPEAHARQERRDDVRGDAGNYERVAIRRRLRDELGADDAAGAALVLDDEALLHLVGELLRDETAERIGGAARTEGHDDFHRPRRIRLGQRSETEQGNHQRGK